MAGGVRPTCAGYNAPATRLCERGDGSGGSEPGSGRGRVGRFDRAVVPGPARSYPDPRSRTRTHAVVPGPAKSYPPGALRYDRVQEGTTVRHGVRPRGLLRRGAASGRSGPHEEIAPDTPGPGARPGRRPEATVEPGACAILCYGAAHPHSREESMTPCTWERCSRASSPLAPGARSERRHPDRPTARPPSCPRRR